MFNLWRIINMPIIIGKSKGLKPKEVKEIRYIGHPERKGIEMATKIAKDFGLQSKKMKPKKIIIR